MRKISIGIALFLSIGCTKENSVDKDSLSTIIYFDQKFYAQFSGGYVEFDPTEDIIVSGKPFSVYAPLGNSLFLPSFQGIPLVTK